MRFRPATTCFAILIAAIVTLIPLSTAPHGPGVASATKVPAHIVPQMAAMPLAFTKNDGQWDEHALFRTSAGGATVWFCRDGIYYQFIHHLSNGGTAPGDLQGLPRRGLPRTLADPSSVAAPHAKEDSVEMVVVKAAFVQANPVVEIAGEDQMTYRCNYFLGNDPAKWRTDVPNYTGVVYRNIYPGIDAHITGAAGQLQTKWEAKPGADLSQIQFRYDGNAAVTLSDAGELMIAAPWGTLMQSAPISRDGGSGVVYQNTAAATYGLSSSQSVADSAGATLVYSTYLGGSGNDVGYGGAVDGSGSAYVTGWTLSADFPIANPLQAAYAGNSDAFVTKLSTSGSTLVYSTYLGGSDLDFGVGIALDSNGSTYVTGLTDSPNFPTANPLQPAYAGGDWDSFVARLSASGTVLVYSTYLGGTGNDEDGGIAVDGSGSAYVTGYTDSPNFPTANPFQAGYAGGGDVFVTKVIALGTLAYSTYVGGSGQDQGNGIAVDGSGSAYVTGLTFSTDFPTANPFQAANEGGDIVFVTKLSATGAALVYSTYLGGSSEDVGFGIAVDKSGSAYVTGFTFSTNFPTEKPLQAIKAGGEDAFITRLVSAGNALAYSTYLGGSDNDEGYRIVVDSSGGAYLTGRTASTNFPTANPLQAANAGGIDAFVTKVSSSGAALVYSTYLGGSDYEDGNGIAVDGKESAYVTGQTYSPDFPTADPLQVAYAGGVSDAFVTKLAGPCACPCQADPRCDGSIDVLDVVDVIYVAFRGELEQDDGGCSKAREDVDCSGAVDILDVAHMINVAFRGMDPATQFCDPCAP